MWECLWVGVEKNKVVWFKNYNPLFILDDCLKVQLLTSRMWLLSFLQVWRINTVAAEVRRRFCLDPEPLKHSRASTNILPMFQNKLSSLSWILYMLPRKTKPSSFTKMHIRLRSRFQDKKLPAGLSDKIAVLASNHAGWQNNNTSFLQRSN